MITGHGPSSSIIRNLFALPARLGRLGVVNPAKESLHNYKTSVDVAAPLVDLIVKQDPQYSLNRCFEQQELRVESKKSHLSTIKSHSDVLMESLSDVLMESLSEDMKRSIKLASQKGASNWLTVLPIK